MGEWAAENRHTETPSYTRATECFYSGFPWIVWSTVDFSVLPRDYYRSFVKKKGGQKSMEDNGVSLMGAGVFWGCLNRGNAKRCVVESLLSHKSWSQVSPQVL